MAAGGLYARERTAPKIRVAESKDDGVTGPVRRGGLSHPGSD